MPFARIRISTDMILHSINPATGKTLQTYDAMSSGAVDRMIDESHQACTAWRERTIGDRSPILRKSATVLRGRATELARLMSQEMGKPIKQGLAEVEKCAWVCEYYAENAERQLADIPIPTDAQKSFVTFEPLGVVLAIMPWNFPLWQVFRFAAPTLMAGNVGLLKHASNVSGCALAIEEIFREAGLPEGCFTTLLIPSSDVKRVIEHPLVRAVTLTGSTPAGRAVASQAGAVLKKTVLELGGSDPYIVLEDADMELAAETCVNSRCINSGQSCIAAKRFIVVHSVLEDFTARFVAKMRAKRIGDPMDEATEIGPLARRDLRDDLHKQVEASIAKGAKLLLGGEKPDGDGAYYPPTVLSYVTPGMPAYDDELFGPVAAIISAHDEADAIRIANDTVFGLGSAVFTRDEARGERVARQLQAGSAFVNALVASDPRLPFGGIKGSGYGRELSEFGIREFVNVKTIAIK